MDVAFDPALRAAWADWLAVAEERVHIGYEMTDPDLGRHARICLDVGLATVDRLRALAPELAPRRILDVGCSAGFKAFALAERFPEAEVCGVDADDLAVRKGRLMAERLVDFAGRPPDLRVGFAEALPWPDASFDLVVCLTTIEHVADVEACIGEMARVLAPGGLLWLEAPNYLWPFEPHLGVFTVPLAPKWLMRLTARAQGAGALSNYVDHLKLVHPFMIERLLRRSGLTWRNQMAEKIDAALGGDASGVRAYRRLGRLAALVQRAGLGGPARRLLLASGVYPSLLYLARRP